MSDQWKMKLSLLRRWWRILTGKSATAVRQGIGRYYSMDRIAGYYNDMTGKVGGGTLLDPDGIPLTQIGKHQFTHFPIAIFQYGLGCYDLYLSDPSQTEMLEHVRQIADWALEQQRENGSWDCMSPIGHTRYSVSSMGQGEGASLLARAYVSHMEEKYLNGMTKALDFMLMEMQSGGTSAYEGEGLYLEEYPQSPRRSVLNGWIFSLFGLYDGMLLRPAIYTVPFEKSVRTLCETLPCYDNGYWSLYDLHGTIASPAYHDVHITLLKALFDLTGAGDCAEYAEIFKGYQSKRMNRYRSISKKLHQKLTEHTESVVLQ